MMLTFVISTEDARRLAALFSSKNFSRDEATIFSSSNGTHQAHRRKIFERQVRWENAGKNLLLQIAFPKNDCRPQVWYLRKTDSKMAIDVTITFESDQFVVRFSAHPKPFYFPIDQYSERALLTIDNIINSFVH